MRARTTRDGGASEERSQTLFGLFSSPPFTDPLLGEFCRSRGMWRGTMDLEGVRVPVALPGSRSAPDARAIDIARAIPSIYAESRGLIAAAMFEHHAPYAADPPRVTRPEDIWPHTSVEYVAVITLDGELGIEIGYRVAWDEEHTLGARLQNGRLVELNGSVLPP